MTNASRFQNSPIGQLVPIRVVLGDQVWEHQAFVPDPLPRTVELSQKTWTIVTEASSALARLDGAGRRLPNPYLLVRPAITREAVSSSALEGTYAELQDVLQAELLDDNNVLDAATAEVRNYVLAAERGLEMIETLPVSRRVLTETHGILMRGSRGDHAEVGAFRRRQNWIGSRARAPVTEALFVPPPPGETLERGIDDWERWVNDRSITLPTVVKTALAHYQFEALHPFIDGNGRIGRLVVVLTFIAAGDLAIPLLNVSPFFERARDEYIDHLRTVSETGDFEPWVAFFAEAVRVQAQLGLTKAEELIGVRDQITQRLRDVGVRGTAIRIAENIIGYPVTTVARAAEQSGVSYESANSAVGRLVDEGVLHEITGGNYRRVFVAQEVLDIINR